MIRTLSTTETCASIPEVLSMSFSGSRAAWSAPWTVVSPPRTSSPAAPSHFDPTISTIRPPFTATFNDYVRGELGFQSDLEYFTLGGGIGPWDWEAKNSYADVGDNLRGTFARNPYMKLFIASGYFDLATPYFATEYTLSHLGLTPTLRTNVTTRRYRSGHMMYLDGGSLSELKRDVSQSLSAVPWQCISSSTAPASNPI